MPGARLILGATGRNYSHTANRWQLPSFLPQMDATAPQATKHVETSGSVPGFPELIQTETGGNDKSFDTESRFLVPTAPQPLNTFAKNFGAFDLAEYMDPGSLTGPLHLPESAQSLHHAFMHGSRQE